MSRREFPKDFIWGAATSAQQIEGGRHAEGRGESIWDRFASQPGKIADGSNPDIACDHYHRWSEDVDLMASLGLKGYRFSLAWPRIMPTGRAPINTPGLDFYDRLVDRLLAVGIAPFPTLYHWDLPQTLQDEGGWANREIVDHFCDYTEAVVRRLGDRVTHWVTHNEPWCITTLGHEEGHHAPGHKNPREAMAVAHHLLLSHGRATQVIRREFPEAKVGLVNIHCPPHPRTDSAPDLNAARWYDGFFNRWYLDPLFKGEYPADAVADRVAAGHLPAGEMPFVQPGDMEIIATDLDFLGLNYYSRIVMQAGPEGKPEAFVPVPREELTDMGWEVYPAGLTETLLRIRRDYAPPAIFIMENGAAYDVPADEDGRIRDTRRIAYLQGHLEAAHEALAQGVPLAGYFTWSLLDNFEWGLGYEKKFGLFAVDPLTHNRIAKDSADWYRQVVTANAVPDAPEPTREGENRASQT
jgi:beta-glucosidase